MKKALFAILAIAVIGGIVYAVRPHRSSPLREEGQGEVKVTPSPTPTTPPPKPSPTPTPSTPQVKTFNITGKNFSFSTSEIRVKKGDTVKINFTSTDGIHDWVVDEFNARTARVSTGDSASVQFVAGKTGTFEYYCSVGTHRQAGMRGNLIVE